MISNAPNHRLGGRYHPHGRPAQAAGQRVYVACKTVNEVAKAIKTMVIRGAPAIGVSAAMGVALGAPRSKAHRHPQFATEFQKNCDLLASTRPTAVNLFWAIERMKQAFAEGAQAGESVEQLKVAAPHARPIGSTTTTSRAAARSAGMARPWCPTTRAS